MSGFSNGSRASLLLVLTLISAEGKDFFEIYVDQGFIKLWRKSIDSAVFQDANLWKLWTWCLIRANHKDVFVPIKTGRGQTVIELKRGQFIFGRRTAAKALKMKPSTIGYRLQILEKLQNLDRQVNHHFTIVTIRNYDKYNDIKNNLDRQVNHQLSTNCPPTDTDKNVKNYKNEKKNPKTYDANFLIFWNAYPKKKNKVPAEKAFLKLNPDEDFLNEVLLKIEEAKKTDDWQKKGGQFIPHPATWLNARGWEDELPIKKDWQEEFLEKYEKENSQ